jgi:hypothetical protein
LTINRAGRNGRNRVAARILQGIQNFNRRARIELSLGAIKESEDVELSKFPLLVEIQDGCWF